MNGMHPRTSRRFTRRGFLVASGVVGAAGIAGSSAWAALADSAGTRDPKTAAGPFVLVTLYGGNDGLDMVIPASDPAYRQARGDAAIAESDALPLADGLSFHPSMTRLKRRYDQGVVAVVRGVSYPDPDHSHFRSMAIWQTASPVRAVPSGWLGRWLDATAGSAKTLGGPIQALSVGAELPLALVGSRRSAAAVPLGPLAVPGGRLGEHLRALFAPATSDGSLLSAIAAVNGDYISVADQLGRLLPHTGPEAEAGPSIRKGGGDLSAQLDVVGRLISAGVPTQAYAVSLGGFDTHADEKPTHTRLLGELDSALDTFLTAVARSPHAQKLVVMVYSEFGRRVALNASGGTDHGTAAPVLVLGPGVRGGMYGEQPSLTRLGTGSDDGDLIATSDFRDVYTTVLEGVLATDPAPSVGGGRRSLGFIRT